MKQLTPSHFEKSFYYIGPGYDIEPLLRFTHLTSTFIYVNLHLSFNEISRWYDKQFEYHPDIELLEKKVDNSFDETTHFDLHPDYISHLTQPSFINREEAEGYYKSFKHAMDDPQWAIQYRLKRKSLDREIKLFYLTAEGLASYIILSHNGKYAPRILTTIQTGILEESEGLMNSYLDNIGVKKPEIWVRGFMPKAPVSRDIFGIEVHRTDNHVLNSSGVFPKVGLSFNHKWVCGQFQESDPTNERHCKGFVAESTEQKLSQLKFRGEFNDDSHQFRFGSIMPGTGNPLKNDIFVVPESICEKLSIPEAQVITWESVISYRYDYDNERYNFIPVSKQLDLLQKELSRCDLSADSTIHIIPYCLEDEGKQYAKTLSTWDIKTTTYVKSPCDFIDLKE